jgi:hypothetical protein
MGIACYPSTFTMTLARTDSRVITASDYCTAVSLHKNIVTGSHQLPDSRVVTHLLLKLIKPTGEACACSSRCYEQVFLVSDRPCLWSYPPQLKAATDKKTANQIYTKPIQYFYICLTMYKYCIEYESCINVSVCLCTVFVQLINLME